MSSLAPPELFWIVEGLLTALLAGLIGAALVGGLLLAAPQALLRFNRSASRWIDTGAPLRALERPRTLERLFYRHHRVLGAGIVLGAGYVLWRWAFAYDSAAVLGLLDPRWRANGLDWIVAALEALLVGLHMAVLVVGVIVLLRPSLLKSVEQSANRWHTGLSAEALDRVVPVVDESVATYPRLSGLVLLAASVWSLFALLPVFIQSLFR